MAKCDNPKCSKDATSEVASEELGLKFKVCVKDRPWAKAKLTDARKKKK